MSVFRFGPLAAVLLMLISAGAALADCDTIQAQGQRLTDNIGVIQDQSDSLWSQYNDAVDRYNELVGDLNNSDPAESGNILGEMEATAEEALDYCNRALDKHAQLIDELENLKWVLIDGRDSGCLDPDGVDMVVDWRQEERFAHPEMSEQCRSLERLLNDLQQELANQ